MSTEANNATNTEVAVEEAVLPSEQGKEESNPYDLSSFKDEEGKLAGKFDTAEDLMKSYNEAQEYIQKINADKAREGNEKVKAERIEQTEQQVADLENSLTQEFVSGEVSEDTISAAKEAGFSDEKIELMKYKAQDSVKQIVDHVGSMEVFKDMIATLSDNLSDAEKVNFNNMIKSEATSEIALLGLQAKYNSIKGNGQQDRVRGQASTQTQRGYQSQHEMMQDLAALRANPNNRAMQTAYEAKMKNTHDDVVYGRK